MRTFAITLLMGTASLFLLAACEQAGSPGTQAGLDVRNPAATVNGYKVAPGLINMYAQARTRSDFADLDAEGKKEVMDEALDLIAIAVDARSRGLDKDPEVATRVELQSLNVLAQASITRFVTENQISEEQLRADYQEQYVDKPKQEYKARHILLKTEEDALAVIKELEGGADFAELAKEKSTGPSASNGGDLGWFSRDAMVKPFGDAVAGMEVGSFGKTPVQTQFGFHVILSEGSRVAPPPDFESVKAGLTTGAQQALVQNFIESTRDKADVRVLIDFGEDAADSQEMQPATEQ